MKTVKRDKTYYFECDCQSKEHVFGVEFDKLRKEAVLSLQLNSYNTFSQRLKIAFKFLFNLNPTGYHWDTVILTEQRFMDLYNIMSRFVNSAGFTNKAAIKIKEGLEEIKQGKKNTAVPQGLHSGKNVTNKRA